MEQPTRSGPPPVPPRIDLGESEDIPGESHDDVLTDTASNVNGDESSTLPKDEHIVAPKLPPNLPKPFAESKTNPLLVSKTTKPSKKTKEINHDDVLTDTASNVNGDESSSLPKDEHIVAPKPPPNLPKPFAESKTNPLLVSKTTKPSKKKKEIKGRPEISIISARPMDQPNHIPMVTDLKNEKDIASTHEAGDNNNFSNKPTTTSSESVNVSTQENKRPTKPTLPPPKPPPYAKTLTEASGAKPSDSSISKKVNPVSGRGKKTKNTKKDSVGSVFYVNTATDKKQSEQDLVVCSKTENEHLSTEVGSKPVVKPGVKLKSDLPAPSRKSKGKEDQKPVEAESMANRKQPKAAVTKPKLRPTIITAKKPKKAATSDDGAEKTKTPLVNAAPPPSLEDSGGLTDSLETSVEGNPPGRPNFPPNTVVEELHTDTIQPQRPKAPPNTIQEDQKHPGKKDEVQKESKNEQPVQKKTKSKPPRPPMAKESARIKPARPAPAQPSTPSKKTALSKPKAKVKAKKSDSTSAIQSPAVQSPDIGGPPRAVAKFDYTGETTDDLSFKVDDTIMLISKVDDWFVGYLENNVMHQGLFPSKFVDVIVNLKEQSEEKVHEPVLSEPHAVALHDFQGQSEEELSFPCGQTIILIERINEEWLKGKINQTVGIFPQNFVRVERDLPPATVISESVTLPAGHNKPKGENSAGEWCRAIHDFQGERNDDLSFVVGNEIRITERLDNDWLKGVLSGKTGIFPASFVEMITDVSQNFKEYVIVTALHDYPGGSPEDLTFTMGDKIKLIERINTDWLMGEFNGKKGLFPASFVENVPESLAESNVSGDKEVNQPKDTQRLAKAVHDFSGDHPGELHFRVGDVIQVLREIDSSWCEGMINNVSGIFPTSFVEMEPLEAKEISLAKALYDFEGDSPQDLSFKTGDVIQLLERVNEDWWTGSIGDKTGHFPATFVEIVASSP